MAGDNSMGERIFAAHLLVEGAAGHRVTLAELGELVGLEMGRKAFSASSVREWQSGQSVPDTRVLSALARVCRRAGVDVDPGWLAFGSESYAPPPVGLATALSRPVSLVRSKRKRRK